MKRFITLHPVRAKALPAPAESATKHASTPIHLLLFMVGLFVALTSTSCGHDIPSDDLSDTTVKNAKAENPSSFTVPVIFHVLYQDAANSNEMIPAQRLTNLIKWVNEIYKGNVYEQSVDMGVTFTMATKNPMGKKLDTPGVEYIRWTGDYPIDPIDLMNGKLRAANSIIWDPNNYINVMIYPFKETDGNNILLGISHTPYTIRGDSALAGLDVLEDKYYTKENLAFPYCSSINSTYANKGSDGNYYQSDRYTNSNHEPRVLNSADVVVTLAHELGHYLGLFHTFAEQLTADSSAVEPVDTIIDTDYCSDTFTYNRVKYVNWLMQYLKETKEPSLREMLKRTNEEDSTVVSTNPMDYSWSMGDVFTPQQRQRVLHVLRHSPLIPGYENQMRSTRSGSNKAPATVQLKPTKILY